MANKTFNEVFEEIRASLTVSKKGKPVKSFSRADFDKLAKAFLNTPDYTIQAAIVKDGQLSSKEIKPVELFRGMIQRILIEFGVDKQEAAKVMNETEFKNVDGLYEVVSELIYQYMNAGKKFDFISREDFTGSLSLKEITETISTHKDIRTGEEFKVEKKAHKLLEKKSKCPKWLKKRQK